MRASSSIVVQCADWIATQQCFARIEKGQGADLWKGHFLCAVYHFEGTMGKITYLLVPEKKTIQL